MTKRSLISFNKLVERLPFIILSLLLVYICLGSPYPFQDYPQHLAIAKVIRDYSQSQLYQVFYLINDGYVNYHSMHHILAFVGSYINLELAFSLLLALYAIIFFLAFRYLISVQFPEEKLENSLRLSFFSILFFSPPMMMGFIPYMLGIPFLVISIALTISLDNQKAVHSKQNLLKIVGIIASIIACGVFHGFPLISLMIVGLCYFMITKNPKFLLISLSSLAYFLTLSSFMGLGLHKQSIWELESEHKFNYPGLQIFQELFKMRWYGSLASLNNLVWSFLESHAWYLMIPIAIIAIASVYFLIKKAPKNRSLLNPGTKAGLLLLGIAFLCPWAVGWPSDFTFIDVRLFATAAILIYASFPSSLLKNDIQRKMVIIFLTVNTAFSYYGKIRFKNKADAALALIDTIPERKVLLSVITDHYSSHIARYTGVYHFLPMFYTLRKNGINSQFWADLTAHIPIKYQRNKSFSVPDWRTWNLKKDHLTTGDYLLANQPYKENNVTKKIRDTYMPLVKKISCIDQWCLYKLNSQEVLDEIF